MSPEPIGIIAVGAALVGVQVTVSPWIVSWLRSLDGRVSHVEQRMSRLEGLNEGAGLVELFERGARDEQDEREAEIRKPYERLGQLAVEPDS